MLIVHLLPSDYVGVECVASRLTLSPTRIPTDEFLPQRKALDYPPFFAYFEFLLSLPARLIDRRIVDVSNLNYDAWSVIAYQRSTVIISELVLGAALLRYAYDLLSRRAWREYSLSTVFCTPSDSPEEASTPRRIE